MIPAFAQRLNRGLQMLESNHERESAACPMLLHAGSLGLFFDSEAFAFANWVVRNHAARPTGTSAVC